ncbi:hypothetical protein [Nocardia arthritidis]|nr:hypothetical protein [Nocardia arthritidis]
MGSIAVLPSVGAVGSIVGVIPVRVVLVVGIRVSAASREVAT